MNSMVRIWTIVWLIVMLGFLTGQAQSRSGFELIRHIDEVSLHGIHLEIAPQQLRSLEGQQFGLNIHVRFDTLHLMTWGDSEFLLRMTIKKGKDTLRQRNLSTVETFYYIQDSTFQIQLVGNYCTSEVEAYSSWCYLTSGTYSGEMTVGKVQSAFSFIVDPIPDSLQANWTRFKHIHERNALQSWDSLDSYASIFMHQPPNTPWRREALCQCIRMLNLQSVWHPNPKQNILMHDLLIQLAREDRQPEFDLMSLVYSYGMFDAQNDSLRVQRLLQFVDETNPRFLPAARQVIARFLKHQ